MFIHAYTPIVVSAMLAFGLATFLLFISRVRGGRHNPSIGKQKPYECGFDPIEHAVPPVNIRFYLVGLLFVIFDVEVVFLFPWAVTLGDTGFLGFCSMVIFLGIVTLGFIYEWVKGVLRWA